MFHFTTRNRKKQGRFNGANIVRFCSHFVRDRSFPLRLRSLPLRREEKKRCDGEKNGKEKNKRKRERERKKDRPGKEKAFSRGKEKNRLKKIRKRKEKKGLPERVCASGSLCEAFRNGDPEYAVVPFPAAEFPHAPGVGGLRAGHLHAVRHTEPALAFPRGLLPLGTVRQHPAHLLRGLEQLQRQLLAGSSAPSQAIRPSVFSPASSISR